jgi:hypothetical protein
MHHYRIYLLSEENRIKDAADAFCVSDDEAREHAAGVIGDYPAVEIWSGRRIVGVFSARELRQTVLRALVKPWC